MRQIDEEIDYLTRVLLKMADIVEANILTAYRYFEGDKQTNVSINDDIVDQHERLIEEMCLNIIIKEHPFASDLRIVSGILKLVADLERIGDHAEDILEFSYKLKDTNQKIKYDFEEYFQTSLWMVRNCILSFVKKDRELANKVIQTDDKVDTMYDQAIDLIINSNPEKKDSAFDIYTTLVVKYIERIADHAVNIAEWVIYIIDGYHKDKKIF